MPKEELFRQTDELRALLHKILQNITVEERKLLLAWANGLPESLCHRLVALLVEDLDL